MQPHGASRSPYCSEVLVGYAGLFRWLLLAMDRTIKHDIDGAAAASRFREVYISPLARVYVVSCVADNLRAAVYIFKTMSENYIVGALFVRLFPDLAC